MKIRVCVLTDNTVLPGYPKGLAAEHGLSFLVEYKGRTLVFDTGQTRRFSDNARILGKDLAAVSTVVLSHGHYDHTGGLPHLLKFHPQVLVLAHPGVFTPKFTNKKGKYKSIGAPLGAADLRAMGARFVFSKKPVRLFPGVTASGIIPMAPDNAARAHVFFTQNGPDLMEDEQALILDTPQGSVVLTGCAHRGVGNILDHAVRLTHGKPIHAVIGGMHLAGARLPKIRHEINAMKRHSPKLVCAGHCTGFEPSARLAAEFKHRFQPLGVGLCLEF